MDLDDILKSVERGELNAAEAHKLISIHAIEKIGDFAKIDLGRAHRRGIPEVVFAEGKQVNEIKEIIRATLQRSDSVLVSRMRDGDQAGILKFARDIGATIDEGKNSSAALFYKGPIREHFGTVGILCAGTSDIGVAEEARLICKAMHCESICSYDVGVAGIHRMLPVLSDMTSKEADAIVVVAGMEGALATMVSSLVDVPVIGVPSSVGYGFGGRGVAALASMLQSCALGMSIVNIDNGIGAGAAAAAICRRVRREKSRESLANDI